jgi:hypothetical protein
MNSENFAARITENGALDRKIWLWKLWRSKWSFQEVLGVFVESLSDWKLWREKIGVLANFGNFFGDFWWVFVVFQVVRT